MINSEFLRFNRKERRALFLLLPLLLCLAFISAFVQREEDIGISDEEWENAKLLFLKSNHEQEFETDFIRINFMDSASLVDYGLSPNQSSAILKVREKTSGFADLSDLYQCQYLPEFWIEANEDRFDFSGYPLKSEFKQNENDVEYHDKFNVEQFTDFAPKQSVRLLNLNQADSAELEQLPGLGAGMAGRIIKFRNRLGGFIHTQQLLEVYGMKMDNYLKFSHLVFIEDAFTPKLICINTCSAEELANHPYIQRRIANSLINVREQHGPYKEIEGLKFSALMNDSIYELIRPYISICTGSSTRDP